MDRANLTIEDLEKRINCLQNFASILAEIVQETATPNQLKNLQWLYRKFDEESEKIGW